MEEIICHDIMGVLNELAPFSSAEGFDNVGLMVGAESKRVDKILICLDCTEKAIEKAEEVGANLIISHHPLIFKGIKSLNAEGKGTESLCFRLCQKDISLISSHTCLDVARGGVADSLALNLGLSRVLPFGQSEKRGRFGESLYFGRYGELEREMGFEELICYVKDRLGLSYLRAGAGFENKRFRSMACLGGSGGSFLDEALRLKEMGAIDCFLTSEIKHSQWLDGIRNGLLILDCGHFETERVVLHSLANMLGERFQELELFVFDEEEPPFIYR